MLFDRVAVIGIGLIGGSFALAARQAGLVGRVVGVARREETRSLALCRGAADEVTDDPAAAVAAADLVYLSTPVEDICRLLRTLDDHLRPGALVTDAGSTKAAICAAARALPAGVIFIGGHPMAGSEQSGMAAARPDLFCGSRYFLTPLHAEPDEPLRKLQELVRGIGARPVIVTPDYHDRMVAATSHLPHLLAWALCGAAAEAGSPDQLAPFTAGAWRDTTRIADSPEELWADILLSNIANLRSLAGPFTAGLERMLQAMEAGDRPALIEALRAARELRREVSEA